MMDSKRYLTWQERTRRGGSLPFKKRRLMFQMDGVSTTANGIPVSEALRVCAADGAAASSSRFLLGKESFFDRHGSSMFASSARQDAVQVPELPLTFRGSCDGDGESHGNDEKMAALALIAAAASSSSELSPSTSTPLAADGPYDNNNNTHATQGFFGEARVLPNHDDDDDTADDSSKSCASSPSDTEENHGKGSLDVEFETSGAKHDVSRGSKAGRKMSSPTPSNTSATTATSGATQTSNSANVQHQHQDKRYTGQAGETCCQATTTRGRACAYVSVDGTPYCHLHADYDKNPPPRRGGGGTGGDGSAKAKNSASPSASRAIVDVSVSPASAPALPLQDSADGTNNTSSSSSGRRNSHAKRAEMHADSPYPLLSMISTDQWFGKKVTVATGPMSQRTGKVEKWGNGWVSVRIPGVGLHNRRSFELYLHMEDENASKSGKKGGGKAGKQQGSKQAKSNARQGAKNARKDDLKQVVRCVSREAVSPSPSSVSSENEENNKSKVCRKEGEIKLVMRKEEDPVPRPPTVMRASTFDSSSSPPSMPAHVLETPQAQKEIVGTTITPHSVQASHLSLPAIGSPIPTNGFQQSRAATKNDSYKVTPFSPRKAYADVPLVQSLLMQEGGGKKKHNIDLLFGTAALDRSRRNISKPTRYEDTEMISSKKRHRRDDCVSPATNDSAAAAGAGTKASVDDGPSSNTTSHINKRTGVENLGATGAHP